MWTLGDWRFFVPKIVDAGLYLLNLLENVAVVLFAHNVLFVY